MSADTRAVAVVGAGSWGTTIAHTLAERGPVSLWARDPALAAELAGARTNSRRLPGVRLDPRVRVEAELAPTVADAAVVLVAVPTGGVRAVIEAVAPALP